MEARSFHSKVLLFGEYTVIQNSAAVAIPFPEYAGILSPKKDDSEKARLSNQSLSGLGKYILSGHSLSDKLDTGRLLQDIKDGVFFDSNIPNGYGLGSSGALVAAIYDTYVMQETLPEVTHLKRELAELESYFHGASSGLDPLVSLMNETIHLNSDQTCVPVSPPTWTDTLCIFLLDTGISRQTSPLVKKYIKKYGIPEFRKMIDEELIPANNLAVKSFLSNDRSNLLNHVKEISLLQFRYFKPMIQVKLAEWLEGLKSEDYFLKLCGAGGGGFILGFAKSEDLIRDRFDNYQIIYSGPRD